MWAPREAWERLRQAAKRADGDAEYLLLETDSRGSQQGDLEPFALLTKTRHSEATVLCLWVPLVFGCGWLVALAVAFPFPTTIQPFIAFSLAVGLSTLFSSLELAWSYAARRQGPAWSKIRWTCSGLAALLTLVWLLMGLRPPEDALVLPASTTDRYFVAANLYNNEAVLPAWSDEMLKLIQILGQDRVFLSIAESNSEDQTRPLLGRLQQDLARLGVRHRIDSRDDPGRRWPYGSAPERIRFLSRVRNRALEPLQSPDGAARLPDAAAFTKLLFFNDVFFDHRAILRLLATCLDGECDYDLVCATDFGYSGLYDSWVARDRCGSPFVPFWPYAKDRPTRRRVAAETPFEVASCWNGVVVLKAEPFIYSNSTAQAAAPRRLHKRGWKSVDDEDEWPEHPKSLPLSSPLQFHATPTDACDASECFLLSYDLHRRAPPGRRPRIWMNPGVRVAYERRWATWHNRVLQVPYVRAWVRLWARGWPQALVDWAWELTRRREACRWAGLRLPPDCPPLPGAPPIHWGAR